MTSANAPIARRYWFADAGALAAIRDAGDAPNWEAGELPITIFCLDAETHEAMKQLASDENVRIVDLPEGQSLGAVLSAELGRERARHLQFAFHAVEDFVPALDLMWEQQLPSESQAVRTAMLPITAFGVGEPASDASQIAECHWIETAYLRETLAGANISSLSDLQAQTAELLSAVACDQLSLITGAYYLTQSEQPALSAAERKSALWRARTAAAWSEIDRLKSEKRVRSGREAALKARYERDLTRQADRSRLEIDRLHRAAGWAGRWRSRLTGIFGRR